MWRCHPSVLKPPHYIHALHAASLIRGRRVHILQRPVGLKHEPS
jgi:hypothetical protein